MVKGIKIENEVVNNVFTLEEYEESNCTTAKEITRAEFEKKYPDINTNGLGSYMPVFLDNGDVLLETEWNGERYETLEHIYYPVYENDLLDNGSFDIAWYEVY